MDITIETLEALLKGKEGEHLEFKEAKTSFHSRTLLEVAYRRLLKKGSSSVTVAAVA